MAQPQRLATREAFVNLPDMRTLTKYGSSLRNLYEYSILENTIYYTEESYSTEIGCQQEISTLKSQIDGFATPLLEGCYVNNSAGAAMRASCNKTDIMVEYFITDSCTGSPYYTWNLPLANYFGRSQCSFSDHNGNFDGYIYSGCRIGSPSLKGNGKSFTSYSREGEACSSDPLYPVDFSIQYSGVCVGANSGAEFMKVANCVEGINENTDINITVNVYADSSCNEFSRTDVYTVGYTDNCYSSAMAWDDLYSLPSESQNGYPEISYVTTTSCQSSAPSSITSSAYKRTFPRELIAFSTFIIVLIASKL
jgi:hypothetical protein